MKYRIVVKKKWKNEPYPYSVERKLNWYCTWQTGNQRFPTVEDAERSIRHDMEEIIDQRNNGPKIGVVKYYTDKDLVIDKLKG